jgi:hypothetical protein
MHKVLIITSKFSAPGSSRAIISHDNITKLNGGDQLLSMDTDKGMHKPKAKASHNRPG